MRAIIKLEEYVMIENLIFGIMLVIALGAGVFTCIYEAGGSAKTVEKEKTETSATSSEQKGIDEL